MILLNLVILLRPQKTENWPESWDYHLNYICQYFPVAKPLVCNIRFTNTVEVTDSSDFLRTRYQQIQIRNLDLYLPVIRPLGRCGGCQFKVTDRGLPSTGTGVRSLGMVPGAYKQKYLGCITCEKRPNNISDNYKTYMPITICANFVCNSHGPNCSSTPRIYLRTYLQVHWIQPQFQKHISSVLFVHDYKFVKKVTFFLASAF